MLIVDLQINAVQLQGGIKMQVEAAERDPGEARKIFGIDQMSIEERKVELRKATLACFTDVLCEAESHHHHTGPRSYKERQDKIGMVSLCDSNLLKPIIH